MNINVIKQKRQSMALKLTSDGIQVLIPRKFEEDDKEVQEFIRLSMKELPEIPELLEQSHSKDKIYNLVKRWAQELNVNIRRIQIRTMTTKWGSISTAGYLTLADDLLHLPIDTVEYVIVHELMHMKFADHAKGWQVSMGIHLPDWRQREKVLQKYALIAE